MGKIELKGVEKTFGNVHVIQGVDLVVEDGSFVVFVGPSGCGKSTLLRLIAGLEDATGGAILIDGVDVIDQPPAKRGLSMVFQSYALYPHMTVRNNIGFGLRMAGVDKAERDKKVDEAAALLNLTPYLERRPGRAFRRPAPARRDRARHRAPAEGVPLRRAALQPRRGAPRQHAAGDRAAAEKPRHHRHLRHARPGRGDDHGRQDRGAECRQGRAGRLAARALCASRQSLRRRLHRLAEDELRHGRASRRSSAARRSASARSISTCRASAARGRARSRSPSISAPTPSSTSASTGWGG